MRRGAALGVMMLISLGLATRAQAQPAGEDPDALMRDGLALRRQRRDREALADFRRAYALRPAPRTLTQIALAEQALGLWVDAETDLRSALLATGDPWIEAHREVLAAGLTDIQTHLGQLEVEADVAGAGLWVNGSRAALLPAGQPLRVEAGSVVIEVRAAGYAPALRHTSVEAGETAHETIHLVPLTAPPPVADVAAASPSPADTARPVPPSVQPSAQPAHLVSPDRSMRDASFVLLGAAAAGLAAGAYFGVRTLATKSDRDHLCPAPQCNDPGGIALDATAHSLADRSTAWFAFGIVAASSGAALFWMSRGRTLPAPSAAVRLGLDIGSRGATAVLGGTW